MRYKARVPITPDTKDWTWVLERTCAECGFDVRSFPREQVAEMIRQNATVWQEVLAHPRAHRVHPATCGPRSNTDATFGTSIAFTTSV